VSRALAALPSPRLETMALAGEELIRAERALSLQGFNVVARLLRDQGTFYEWDHYPAGDLCDRASGAQYFYHAHGASGRRAGEHGHFHCFLRAAGTGLLHHLVAVAMDDRGRPVRLFTVNRWVTDDSWIDAAGAIRLLDRFHLDEPKPSRWVNRWLQALLCLFGPDIGMLLRRRDQHLAEWRRRHPGLDALAARQLDTLSETAISIDARIDELRRTLLRTG
jgi:hypothetical protein